MLVNAGTRESSSSNRMARTLIVNLCPGIKDGEADSTASEIGNANIYGSFDDELDELEELRQYIDINDANIEGQIANLYNRHRALFLLLVIAEFMLELGINAYLFLSPPKLVHN